MDPGQAWPTYFTLCSLQLSEGRIWVWRLGQEWSPYLRLSGREAQELVLAKAFQEPKAGLKEQLQSCYLKDRIRTQLEAETKDVYPRIEKTSWLLLQMAFRYPISLTGLLVPWCREEGDWVVDLVSSIYDVMDLMGYKGQYSRLQFKADT